jgi:hypothetical protein
MDSDVRKIRAVVPRDLDSLLAQLRDRSLMLLQLVPALGGSQLASADPGLSQLQEKWTSMLPPRTLAPLLQARAVRVASLPSPHPTAIAHGRRRGALLSPAALHLSFTCLCSLDPDHAVLSHSRELLLHRLRVW